MIVYIHPPPLPVDFSAHMKNAKVPLCWLATACERKEIHKKNGNVVLFSAVKNDIFKDVLRNQIPIENDDDCDDDNGDNFYA